MLARPARSFPASRISPGCAGASFSALVRVLGVRGSRFAPPPYRGRVTFPACGHNRLQMPRLPCISKCKAKAKSSSPAIRYPSGLVCGARPVVRPPPPLALAIPPSDVRHPIHRPIPRSPISPSVPLPVRAPWTELRWPAPRAVREPGLLLASSLFPPYVPPACLPHVACTLLPKAAFRSSRSPYVPFTIPPSRSPALQPSCLPPASSPAHQPISPSSHGYQLAVQRGSASHAPLASLSSSNFNRVLLLPPPTLFAVRTNYAGSSSPPQRTPRTAGMCGMICARARLRAHFWSGVPGIGSLSGLRGLRVER